MDDKKAEVRRLYAAAVVYIEGGATRNGQHQVTFIPGALRESGGEKFVPSVPLAVELHFVAAESHFKALQIFAGSVKSSPGAMLMYMQEVPQDLIGGPLPEGR